MSKILANQIANYGDDSPIEIKEGLNIPAGKPIQAAGVAGTSGQFLSSTGTSITWTDVFDGNYNSLTNKPTIPSAQVNADWNATGGISVILNKPVVPALPSIVTAAASSTSSLAYNSANGEFTYTPPDLSSYAQSSSLNSANWDTAYGWGNHASAGYLTSATASSFLSLSDTPSSYTAKAFLGTNATGNALVSSPLLFEYGNKLGIGTDNPASILHLKQESDAVYMTFESNSGVPVWVGTYGTIAGFFIEQGSTNNSLLTSDANDYVSLYGAGTKRFETDASGVEITGDLNVTGTITGTGVSASLANLNDTSLGTPQNGQVLKYDGSNWIATTDLVGSGGTGIILSDLSVATASASSGGSLAYNNALGVFTYTPPDLSGYLTSETDPVFGASAAAGILSSNISNWDAAYGWGDHSGAGYLSNLVEDTSPELGGTLDMKTFTIQYNGGGISNTLIGGNYGNFPSFFGHYQAAGALGWQFRDDGTAICRADGPSSNGTGIIALQIGNFSDLSCLTIDGAGTFATDSSVTATSFVKSGGTSSQYLMANGTVTTGIADLGINATNRLLYQASNGDTDILAAGNSGEVLTSQGDGVAPIWTTVSGGGGASVTIADTAPAATAGDLWWESDTGRLKIYYQDTDSTQWVDVSPPLSQITSEIASGSNKVDFQDGVSLTSGAGIDNCLVLDPVGPIVIDAHILPLTNNTYDIGSAERKIRDVYEDQGSDVRIKENFEKFTGGLQFINSLEVATFTYKELEFNGPKAGKRETGLIAQNVKDCLDNSTYESYRLWNENPDSYQGLDKKQLIPALVNAIQELNARVDDLFKELENK